MVVARCVAVVPGLLAVCGAGCTEYICPLIIPDNQPAVFHLSCGAALLTNVTLSGVCSVGDGSPSTFLFGATKTSVGIRSPRPGDCHVVLTFATGFVFSSDVTFVSQNDTPPPGCAVHSYTVPTRKAVTVNNPPETCGDAGRLNSD